MSKRRANGKPKTAASKAAVAAKSSSSGSVEEEGDFSVQDMQRVLNLVSTAFVADWRPGDESFSQRIQAVKCRLFERDFEGAFLDASEEEREAYVVRWSSARALGYLSVLADVFKLLIPTDDPIIEGLAESMSNVSITGDISEPNPENRILYIGGGAGAELLATGFIVGKIFQDMKCKVDILDIAPWDSTLHKLYDAMTTPPMLSKYAAPHVKARNKAMVDPTRLSFSFLRQDILSFSPEKVKDFCQTRLITFFFTLNELFTASLNQTRQCLQLLKETLLPGALLLVVDSAGSYSHVQLGKEAEEKRNYPMVWLLDLIMTPKIKAGDFIEWEKVTSSQSTWFRIPTGLKYPVELENMRYQLHMYRKLESPTTQS